MASTTKVSVHSRSISFPSRSHPFTVSVEEHLCRLRTLEETTSSSTTKCNKLSTLIDLYECVEDLLQLPAAKQDYLSCAEDILCGSIRLLDLCSTSKDSLSLMRSSVQQFESSIRRRESDISSKTGSYLICKKKVKKMISKCFTSSKKSKINKSTETPAIVGLLREVEEVSIRVFESIFSSICPAKVTSNRWSLVFKSTQSKRVHCEGDIEENINQIQKMDMILEALNKKSSKANDILGTQEVLKCLMAMDMNMQECEEKLDLLVRSLIKTRVSILNVLNH
ncbi:hypothetical protein DCAR_0519165 [Daucus carota subsp. sativus]|uniref:Uncharacterized protein n=1 Tax=Daucus carota subsp. sativus TaxID=79200 RepID=A0A164XRQ8_DAUCS|nr:PREDICTED: uncharacterized protein LOC108221258 [Daucus carota subsp. sativus]WOG99809.1 hypothetical protein DCAR_0519165 [Daucus carota subsp. sativus]